MVGAAQRDRAGRQNDIRRPHRFQPGLDVEVAGTIDPAGFGIGVFNGGNGDVGGRRQIAVAVLRPHVIAAPFPLRSSGTLGTQSLGS